MTAKRIRTRLAGAAHREDRLDVVPSIVRRWRVAGVTTPQGLHDRDPWRRDATRDRRAAFMQDACLLDAFIVLGGFARDEPASPRWSYGAGRRKARVASAAATRSRQPDGALERVDPVP